jgi:hypothetical protein
MKVASANKLDRESGQPGETMGGGYHWHRKSHQENE